MTRSLPAETRRAAWAPALLCIALLAAGSGVAAQQAPSVLPGERVRVTAPDLRREVGSVEDVRADTLVFRLRGAAAPMALHLPEVRRLEVSRGNHHPLRGALVGGAAGGAAGIGVALLMLGSESCEAGDCLTVATLVAIHLPYVTALAGGVAGALRASRTERWVSVPPASLAPAGAVTLPAGIPPGALVRVRARGATARPLVARVVGVRGDSLVVRAAGSPGETAVPLAEVDALEIGAGRARTASTLRGAAVGAAVGAALIGAVAYRIGQGDEWLVEHGEVGRNALWAAGFTGVPVGAAVGGLAGYAIGTERWLLLPPLARVAVSPGRDGALAVGVTLPAP